MLKNKGPFTLFRKLLKNNDEQSTKRPPLPFYMIVMILIGIAIMLMSNLFANKNTVTQDQLVNQFPEDELNVENDAEIETFKRKQNEPTELISAYENSYEMRLKDALEMMIGVDNVTVVVNIDATNKKVFEKNSVINSQYTTETDREGGKRQIEDQTREEQIVMIRDGDGDGPLLLETKKPQIRGVLVIAEGAENINVKKWIVESVSRLLDVPSHRVAVMPKKTKGD